MTSNNAPSTKRLFIFAAYDKADLIDDTLLYYLTALSHLGHIVFTMDNNTPESEMAKLKSIPNIIHANATRHGEYDFGSYKRGYKWAKDNNILGQYDWIYMVNDSVLGPLYDLGPILTELESRGTDYVGMVSNDPQLLPTHIQSWFVGMRQAVATSKFFDDFITQVAHQTDKQFIVYKYEIRMSQLMVDNGYTYSVLYENHGALLYTNPHQAMKIGIPFVKKMALGHLYEPQSLYTFAPAKLVSAIMMYAARHNISMVQEAQLAPYVKRFRMTILGIPFFTIYTQTDMARTAYKMYLFDKIPILKIWFQSNPLTSSPQE
ncbi:MAG: rhamnan synthesis F family protein [Alphaproteobacteria bacterium]|nr:rhamnan synthesis F family protein [Alphaproteobacteria bacterium]